MHKVGMIGDKKSVLGFKAVGVDAFPCSDSDEAKKALQKTAREHYAVIFITENLAKDMPDAIAQYKSKKLPAIIPVPGIDGNYGVGLKILRQTVEHAIGADILFGGD